MSLLDKLERKFGRYAIKGLMVYVVSLNLAVYLFMRIDTTGNVIRRLILDPYLVMQGEVWRLITYIFIPPTASLLWILFTLYFYYMIGTGLEQEWGSFKFNIYYFLGMFGTAASAFITGHGVTAFYLNMSLFLAFAYIYPNYQILLFFIIPVRMKFLAWLDVIILAFLFLTGGTSDKLAITVAIANFLLFFGKDMFLYLKNNQSAYSHRRSFARKIPKIDAFHKCTICGITEKDDRNAEFRYCSKCEGHYEYCMEHLQSHEHIKEQNS